MENLNRDLCTGKEQGPRGTDIKPCVFQYACQWVPPENGNGGGVFTSVTPGGKDCMKKLTEAANNTSQRVGILLSLNAKDSENGE